MDFAKFKVKARQFLEAHESHVSLNACAGISR
jgi:hypothetical protein